MGVARPLLNRAKKTAKKLIQEEYTYLHSKVVRGRLCWEVDLEFFMFVLIWLIGVLLVLQLLELKKKKN